MQPLLEVNNLLYSQDLFIRHYLELLTFKSSPLKHFSVLSILQRLIEIDHVPLMIEAFHQIERHHIV